MKTSTAMIKSATPKSAQPKSAQPKSAQQKNATPKSAQQKNATPLSAKTSNSDDISTGIKYRDQEVFHTPDLKNPLSGFYTRDADGNRQKLVLAELDSNLSNRLISTLKKKNATPPPGKTVNPKTGRFVKEVDKEVEKDPEAC